MKNLKGKTVSVEHPYEIYKGSDGWEWRVLKHYSSEEKERTNDYARVYCAVKSPFTFGSFEFGDTYIKDIRGVRVF